MSAGPVLVVGWDASAASRAALAFAARIAGHGRIVAVHAHEATAPAATARWQELLGQDAAERSRALLAEIPSEGLALEQVTVEARSEDGTPVEALQRVADAEDADAIVVGSRGLGAAGGLVGSVSEALLRAASRPVIVIPPGAVADR